MIEEQELRELFAAEAAETLERMERGLLALERTPGERPLVESVFRQAHSLKGSAASLGLTALESLAHHFEDALDAARHGRQPLVPERADQLYRALDALRALVEEAVTGRPSQIDLRATLKGLESGPVRLEPLPSASPDVTAAPKDSKVAIQGEPATFAELAPATVRVETASLDRALADLGDLVVTSARIGLRRADAQQLQDLYEAWARDRRLRGSIFFAEGQRMAQFGSRLEQMIRTLAEDQTRLEYIIEHLRDEIQEMRLVPMSGLFHRFRRVVRDLARQQGKEIQLTLEGEETTADRRLLEVLSSPLTHLIRNAVDHGVETPAQRLRIDKPGQATLRLSACRRGPMLEVSLADDGAGLDLEAVRTRALDLRLRTKEQLAQAGEADLCALIFAPGFSTRTVVSALSGRGTGLDAVRSEVEDAGGTITVESQAGRGTLFRLRIPVTLSTSQVLVCSCGPRLFAVPLAFVERSLMFDPAATFPLEGQPCLDVEGVLIPITDLESALGGPPSGGAICLILTDQTERHGFVVNGLLGVMEIVVKPFLESRLVGGASILPDGRVCLVLQSTELLRQARRAVGQASSRASRSVLLAEDSPTVAACACRSLEAAGYQVTLVTDGAQGWREACRRSFDAVISDIEMPHMDGLELTRRLRGLASYAEVPILLVTSSLSEDTRLEGMEAGASAYLPKSTYQEGTYLTILERLL